MSAPPTGATPTVVVAAALLRDGHLLAARRTAPPELAGRWELPGGKVEPGEDPVAALVRECREELGVEVELIGQVGGDWPLRPGMVLRAYAAVVRSGEPAPLQDHDELRWLPAGAWSSVDWLDADVPVVARIAQA